MRNTANKSD